MSAVHTTAQLQQAVAAFAKVGRALDVISYESLGVCCSSFSCLLVLIPYNSIRCCFVRLNAEHWEEKNSCWTESELTVLRLSVTKGQPIGVPSCVEDMVRRWTLGSTLRFRDDRRKNRENNG